MNKQLIRDAEKAAQHYIAGLGYIHQRKAIKTMYQSVDFFGSDIVAKNEKGDTLYVQVTTGAYEALRHRKRKLEKIPWNSNDKVWILQMQRAKDGRSYKYWFVKHNLNKNKVWEIIDNNILIHREWFSKYSN